MLERPRDIRPIQPIGTVHAPMGAVAAHPPQPQHFSYPTFLWKRVQEDLGRYTLYCVLSLTGRWVLPRSWNVSAGAPVYVVVTALALTVIHALREVLFFPPSSFNVKCGDVTILGMSFGLAAAFVKVSHIQVSSFQGMVSFIIIFPIAEIMYQLFEE